MSHDCDEHDDDIAKASRAGVLAASVANRQRATSALSRAYLEGVRALDAWLSGEQANLLTNPFDVAARLPVEELLGLPVSDAWLPSLREAMARAPFMVGKKKDPLTVAGARLAREQAANLVVDITATTRRAIRTIIARGISQNWDIPRVARALRDTVGLHSRYGTAVQALRDRLIQQGLSGAKLDREVEKYRQRLLRSRAMTIARTETAFAENRARYDGWQQQMISGELDTGLRRIWIVGDPCPICRDLAMHPPVAMGVPFQSGVLGIPLLCPPAHPRCKCSMGLVRVDPQNPDGSPRLVGSGIFSRVSR